MALNLSDRHKWILQSEIRNVSILIKRNKICSALAQADMRPYIPQGAYYVLADMTAVPGNSGKEKAMNLLKKTGEIFLYWQLPRDE